LNIAESFEEDHDKMNNELDGYVDKMMSSLFHAAVREDASEHHLQASSYEAFASVVHSVSFSCQNLIFQACILFRILDNSLNILKFLEYSFTLK
jgi:hypothetical protein